MTRQMGWRTGLAAAAVLSWTLATPSFVEAQRSGQRGGSSGSGPRSAGGGRATGSAVPRGGESGGPRGTDGGGDRSGGTAAAAPRSGGSEQAARAPSDGGGDRTRDGSTASARPRGDRPVLGRAVERQTRPIGVRGNVPVFVPGSYYGGYYPWGYGGLGFGGYYGGFYDPWYWGGYPSLGYGYGYGYSYPYRVYSEGYGYDGALRLKIKPRDAAVYVDGYFAGRVDEFDGVFQRLHVEPGPHRIEVRADGYEPLSFEVRIQPDRTITYTGELTPVRP